MSALPDGNGSPSEATQGRTLCRELGGLPHTSTDFSFILAWAVKAATVGLTPCHSFTLCECKNLFFRLLYDSESISPGIWLFCEPWWVSWRSLTPECCVIHSEGHLRIPPVCLADSRPRTGVCHSSNQCCGGRCCSLGVQWSMDT